MVDVHDDGPLGVARALAALKEEIAAGEPCLLGRRSVPGRIRPTGGPSPNEDGLAKSSSSPQDALSSRSHISFAPWLAFSCPRLCANNRASKLAPDKAIYFLRWPFTSSTRWHLAALADFIGLW